MQQNSPTYPSLFFFLGAGASMDLGFPSGLSLRNRIGKILSGTESSDLNAILLQAFKADVLERLIAALGDAQAPSGRPKGERSIDAILHDHKEDVDLVLAAKVSIRHLILEHEGRVTDDQIGTFWLTRFFDEYLRNCDHLDALHFPGRDGQFLNDLSVCTLNYDRVFEHTFRLWCARRFPNSSFMEMAPFQCGLPTVFHAHGSVGKCFGSGSIIPFGSAPPRDPDEAREAAGEMKLWFEPSNEYWDWSITNRAIDLRPDLLVLGYGFHDVINRRFASYLTADRRLRRVISTAYGMTDPKREEIRKRFSDRFRLSEDSVELQATCADAIDLFFDQARAAHNGRA